MNKKNVLYIKDLIPHLNESDSFHWISLCRQPFFVPETKMINDLLSKILWGHYYILLRCIFWGAKCSHLLNVRFLDSMIKFKSFFSYSTPLASSSSSFSEH